MTRASKFRDRLPAARRFPTLRNRLRARAVGYDDSFAVAKSNKKFFEFCFDDLIVERKAEEANFKSVGLAKPDWAAESRPRRTLDDGCEAL